MDGQLLSLTAEQRERIRRNRERALMLRAMNVGSEQGGRSKNEIERKKESDTRAAGNEIPVTELICEAEAAPPSVGPAQSPRGTVERSSSVKRPREPEPSALEQRACDSHQLLKRNRGKEIPDNLAREDARGMDRVFELRSNLVMQHGPSTSDHMTDRTRISGYYEMRNHQLQKTGARLRAR